MPAPSAAGRARSAASGRSPPRPPMPSIPSSTRSARPRPGRPRRPGGHTRPPARRSAASPGAWARSGSSRTAVTRAPRPGEVRAGEQRVAAVVAGADEQGDAPSVDRCRAAAGTRWPARSRRAASSAPSGSCGEDRRLGRADLRGGVEPAHRSPVAREALRDDHGRGDAAVVAQRDVPRGDAELRGPAGDRPRGPPGAGGRARRPSPRRRASAGRPGRRAPWPAPPWPRTGRRATHRVRGAPEGVCCSVAVNSRSRRPGRAGQRLGEPLDRHDVDPDPDDHPVSLPCRSTARRCAASSRAQPCRRRRPSRPSRSAPPSATHRPGRRPARRRPRRAAAAAATSRRTGPRSARLPRTRPVYSTVTDLARFRGWSTS